MRLSLWALLAFAMLLGLLAPLMAQSQPAGKDKPMEPAKAKPTLDKFKLPPGGVIVVVEQVKEALTLLPKMILLSPEEYQTLMDRIGQLEKQLKSDKKAPHSCKLNGRLEGDFIVLSAEFTFTTE